MGSSFSVKTVTGSYNMTALDNTINVVQTAAVAISLPPISTVPEGTYFRVIDAGYSASTNNITVVTADALINNSLSSVVITVNGGVVEARRVNGAWVIQNDVNALQGPASATNLGVPVFSGTSGKVLTTSNAVFDALGNMSGEGWGFNKSLTAYTLQASDSGKVILMQLTATQSLTVPATLPAGFYCDILQAGTSKVTCAPAAGATLTGNSAITTTAGNWARISLYCVTNTSATQALWVLSGSVG